MIAAQGYLKMASKEAKSICNAVSEAKAKMKESVWDVNSMQLQGHVPAKSQLLDKCW